MDRLIEMLNYAEEVYSSDELEAVYSSDIITNQMLDGEYRIILKLRKFVRNKIEEQEEALKNYEGGITD